MKLCKIKKINPHKSAFIISCLLLWLFSYEPTRIAFYQITNSDLSKNVYFIFLWFGILGIFISFILIIKIRYEKTTYLLTLFGSLLIVIQIVNFSLQEKFWQSEKHYEINQIRTTNYNFKKESLRDIYYIILDEYPGYDQLNELLNFNNDEFIIYLKNKGFYVVPNSYSNYCTTRYAMSCYLNMQYHQQKKSIDDPDIVIMKHGIPYNELIENNQIAFYLKSIGYSYNTIVDYSDEPDLYVMNWYNTSKLSCHIENHLLNLFRLTLLRKPIITNIIGSVEKRQLVRKQIKMLHQIIREPGPKFVYVHFQLPHWPYIFNENGENINFLKLMLQRQIDINLYLKQLMFANEITKEFINAILIESTKSPIIIIQGDHGPRDFCKNEKNRRELTLSIINAYYLPEGGDRYLYDSITPINTFRVILNYYFKQNLPLLEDKLYYSYYFSSKLIDMTNKLR